MVLVFFMNNENTIVVHVHVYYICVHIYQDSLDLLDVLKRLIRPTHKLVNRSDILIYDLTWNVHE